MSDVPEAEIKQPVKPKKAEKVVAKTLGGKYKIEGVDYVKVVVAGVRKWYPVTGDLQASYTINVKEFDVLKRA